MTHLWGGNRSMMKRIVRRHLCLMNRDTEWRDLFSSNSLKMSITWANNSLIRRTLSSAWASVSLIRRTLSININFSNYNCLSRITILIILHDNWLIARI